MAISIRERYKLPTLDYANPLDTNNCRFDLIRLRYKNFYLRTGPDFDLTAFTGLLKSSDLCTQTGRNPNKLSFKNHWLFSGLIYLKPAAGRVNIDIQLDLNLSRFIALCAYPNEQWGSAPVEELLRTDEDLEEVRQRSTFNDVTNMLSPEQWRQSHEQQALFQRYLRFVQQYVEEQLRLAALYDENLDPNRPLDGDDCQFHGVWGDCVIYRTEAYHEFFTPDALSAVHSLRDKMQEAVSNVTEHVYGIPRPIQEGRVRWRTRQNALALSCNMERKGIDLIVYAKAPRRIRFEVRFTESLKTMIGRGLRFEGPAGSGITDNDISQTLSWVRQNATERLGHFINEIARLSNNEAPSMVAFLDMMHEVNVACDGDKLLMRDLLSILVNNKAVSRPKEADDHLAGAMDHLISQHVVERARIASRNRSYRFIAVGKYRSSLEAVSEALHLSEND